MTPVPGPTAVTYAFKTRKWSYSLDARESRRERRVSICWEKKEEGERSTVFVIAGVKFGIPSNA